jgi:RimJ/RimL family protein N-acetyltransferase
LRPFQPTDAERIVEACSDERTQYWLADLPTPYTLGDAHGFMRNRQDNLASGDGISWAIADQETDELLGCVSVFGMSTRTDKTVGEIGYWMHPSARGRKVMSTAVGLLIDHAFKPVAEGGLGRRRLVLLAAEGNSASAHVAEVNGFTQFGRMRKAAARRDGTYVDHLGFDLLASERLPG